MNFDLAEDQLAIRATARELLTERAGPERVRAAAETRADDDVLWRELCGLGWPGIAVGEDHGGQGLGAVELAVLLEELGAALAATPMLGTVLAAAAIDAAGSEAQRARWLPPLAAGDATGALGTGELVADAPGAAVLVLLDPDGGARLLAAADAAIEPAETMDATRRYGRVRGEGEPLPGDAGAARDRVAAAVAAELVGVCRRTLEMTVDYVRDRRQFGVPVGAFQAVSHRCAHMLLHTESARSAAYYAAWAADAAPERLGEAAELARVTAREAGREVTGSAIQAHGGIGFTWEADVHWFYKRAQLDAALLGGGARARLARRVAAGRAAGTVP